MTCSRCEQSSVVTVPMPLCQAHAADYFATMLAYVAMERERSQVRAELQRARVREVQKRCVTV